MTSIVTITSKNQVTLPAKLTRLLGLSTGIRLFVKLEDNSLKLEKVPSGFIDLQGIVQKTAKSKHLTVEQAKIKAMRVEATRLM